MTTTSNNWPPLNENWYSPEGDELQFFREQTQIQDEGELKKHILTVQEKAYKVYGYPCIRRFAFLRLKISHLPAYERALQLAKERSDSIFLDIGCCFGNDLRKIVTDGWPVERVVASDLQPEFWALGHELFRTTPETFPAVFIPGDAFDAKIIAPREPFYEMTGARTPSLEELTSLTPLQGHVSVIHASSFFHLFDEQKQLELAKLVATLLSPTPGSMVFGVHGGQPEKGWRTEVLNSAGRHMFCHSPDSWKDLWDGQIFRKGSVRVDCGLLPVERPDFSAAKGAKFFILYWSVTRQ